MELSVSKSIVRADSISQSGYAWQYDCVDATLSDNSIAHNIKEIKKFLGCIFISSLDSNFPSGLLEIVS